METRILESAVDAANIISGGGLCAFPTETVYGLGVNATDHAAVGRLFIAKGRPSDNPLIVHLGAIEQLESAAAKITTSARMLLEAFAPGPITVVLPKQPSILDAVTGGLPTVGIRIPANPLAQQMLSAAGIPVAAPSANLSGRPSCTTWQSVVDDLGGRIDAVLKGAACSVGIESTVVDCSTEVPIILRPGGVTIEQMRDVVPSVRDLHDERQQAFTGIMPNSPGLRHPHYQPRATVLLADDSWVEKPLVGKTVFVGIGQQAELERTAPGRVADRIIALDSVQAYAMLFYELLRESDRDGYSTIMLQPAPSSGLGASLLDRQRRAAGLETR